MFEVHCPQHARRVLLDSSRIRAIANTGGGIVITWRCWCGQVGSSTTGARRTRPAPARTDAA